MGAERLLQFGQALAKRAKDKTMLAGDKQLVPLAQTLLQTAARLRPQLRIQVSLNVAKLSMYCRASWDSIVNPLKQV